MLPPLRVLEELGVGGTLLQHLLLSIQSLFKEASMILQPPPHQQEMEKRFGMSRKPLFRPTAFLSFALHRQVVALLPLPQQVILKL